jgi:hypothetical protein
VKYLNRGCHPEELRGLSLQECAAIQTFRPGFVWAGSQNRRYKQLGNAVPRRQEYRGSSLARKCRCNRGDWRPLPIKTMVPPNQLDNSLEALSNLLYQIRRSLDDPAKATTYLDFADRVLIDIAAKHSFRRAGSPDADNL